MLEVISQSWKETLNVEQSLYVGTHTHTHTLSYSLSLLIRRVPARMKAALLLPDMNIL